MSRVLPRIWSKSDEGRRRRRIVEEDTNRDGHWVRDFSVRQESWPIIEHWASEYGYHLIALKGRRRLYVKGDSENGYRTLVDIRHDENRIVLSSWVSVGFHVRLLSLFLLPIELPIDPGGGWKGIRTRRDACRDLNALLIRFRQPEIVGSHSFHITDLDLTSLTLAIILLVPVHVFLIASLLKVQLHTGLSNALLSQVAGKAELLLMVACGMVLLHHFAITKFFTRRVIKLSSLSVLTAIFACLTVFFATRTRSEMVEARITHHCVVDFDEARCAKELSTLSAKERETLRKQIEIFEKHLTLRTDQVFGPNTIK